jgi:hypothetical protein
MMRVADRRRGLVRCFSFAAAAVLLLAAVPGERAEAMSPISPGSAPAAKFASGGLMAEVRFGHGGGGGHGGGFHHGYRFHHHRRFYGGGYYYPAYYHHRRCRVIWTYYGPRRICRWHHWRHYW